MRVSISRASFVFKYLKAMNPERIRQNQEWIRQRDENRAWNISNADGVFVGKPRIYRDKGMPRLPKMGIIFERKK